MIFTAWYYTGSLAKGDLIIRDDRFYPGKYFETWPLWCAYIRKNYPDEHIVIFNDESSPIPLSAGLEDIKEPIEFIKDYSYDKDIKLHVKSLNKYSGRYFQAMQRNLCEGLVFAYKNNVDFLWIDNDAFLNSNLDVFTKDTDVFAPQILDHQFTCDSVCTFISKKRLHELDALIDLEEYLTLILQKAPENVRIHTFQEGGLYKMFCYGKVKSSININLSHLSNLTNFVKFLVLNPLDIPQYNKFLNLLKNLDLSKFPSNTVFEFPDMYFEERAAV